MNKVRLITAALAASTMLFATQCKEKGGDAGGAEGIEISTITGGATLTGSVTFKGKAPKLATVDMSADPACVSKWKAAKKTAKSEALVLGKGGKLGNVFVAIKSGLAPKQYKASNPVVVDQKDCRYIPHVFGLLKGQGIQFKNSDGVLHNVHPTPALNRGFNVSMPASMTISEVKTFKKVEAMFRIKCDVHPWMNSWATVLDHPYFATSDESGSFTIKGLPAGSYEVEAWHEKLGTKVAKVTLSGTESKTVDFTFSK